MKMTLSETIQAPVEQVFRAFADFEQAAERIDGIQSIQIITDGPIGKGTRFRETRKMFGHESTEEMQITKFKPNRMYTVEADSCGAHIETTFHFRPQGNATEVELDLQTYSISLFAKLMWPLGMIIAGSMKKTMRADMRQLKDFCERPITSIA